MGLLVYPKVPGGKTPLLKGGYKLGTNDEVQVATWWLAHPNANIGITTGIPTVHGALIRDPLFVDVIDFDHKRMLSDGALLKHGEAAYNVWRDKGGLAGHLAISRTRHDGWHVWYPASEGRYHSMEDYHVDFLGTGTSVTAPGSIVRADAGIEGSGSYLWESELVPGRRGARIGATYSKFVRSLTDKPGLKPAHKPRPVSVSNRPGAEKALVDYLARALSECNEGNRNRDLYAKACYLFGRYPDGNPVGLIEAALTVGLSEDEVCSVLLSAATTTGASWTPQ
jgi:hypothetical protein